MPVSPSERQLILGQVNTLAAQDLLRLWRAAEALSSTEFAQFVIDGFPAIADPYAAMAADLAADWYDDSAPDLPYTAIPTGMPDVNALNESTSWALGATGEAALARLSGTLQRAVYNSARDTIYSNTAREPGSKWVRYASANACAFCALLATRGQVYASKQSALRVVGRGRDVSTNYNADGTRKSGGQAQGVKTRGSRPLGEKYHDHCHCVAVEVRPGGSYSQPAHIQDFDRAYKKAFADLPVGTPYDKNNSVLKAVLADMRQDLGAR